MPTLTGESPFVYTPEVMALVSSAVVSKKSDVGDAVGTGVGASEGRSVGVLLGDIVGGGGHT